MMKPTNLRFGASVLAFFLAGTAGFGQFYGDFKGYYSLPHWSTALTNNAQFQGSASVEKLSPGSVRINGAADPQEQTNVPQPPASIVDFTIVLEGTGLQPVMFGYLFTGLADGYDAAQLIYSNGSGFQVVANLSTVIGVQQTYSGQLQGGSTFGFRLYSNNDRNADTLVISVAVPEPSTLTLLGLGAVALLGHWRRRRS